LLPAVSCRVCFVARYPYVPARISIRRAMITSPVSSPCSKVCIIDPRSALCRGCGRTLGEIGRWGSMAETERLRIMSELAERMRAAGLGQPARAGA